MLKHSLGPLLFEVYTHSSDAWSLISVSLLVPSPFLLKQMVVPFVITIRHQHYLPQLDARPIVLGDKQIMGREFASLPGGPKLQWCID